MYNIFLYNASQTRTRRSDSSIYAPFLPAKFRLLSASSAKYLVLHYSVMILSKLSCPSTVQRCIAPWTYASPINRGMKLATRRKTKETLTPLRRTLHLLPEVFVPHAQIVGVSSKDSMPAIVSAILFLSTVSVVLQHESVAGLWNF